MKGMEEGREQNETQMLSQPRTLHCARLRSVHGLTEDHGVQGVQSFVSMDSGPALRLVYGSLDPEMNETT